MVGEQSLRRSSPDSIQNDCSKFLMPVVLMHYVIGKSRLIHHKVCIVKLNRLGRDVIERHDRAQFIGIKPRAGQRIGVKQIIVDALIDTSNHMHDIGCALVNGVEPGYIRTAAMELLANEEGMKQMARYIPVGYIGAPEDVANAMLYLASDEARYVTGQTICVDGGSTLPESPVFLEELDNIKALQGSGAG